jgi:hypothetical protein
MKYLLIIMVAILASCASVPTTPAIPEGKVQVSEKELNQVLDAYIQLQKDHQELERLREWQDKMFF